MFDSFILKDILNIINDKLLNLRVQRIYSDSSERFLLKFKSDKFLLIDLFSESSHINLINHKKFDSNSKDNILSILRKYLLNAKLIEIEQLDFDRIVIFKFETKNIVHERIEINLIIEIMGRRSNLIITDSDFIILNAMKKTPTNIEASRYILKGEKYTFSTEHIHPQSINDIYSDININKVKGFYKKLDRLIKYNKLDNLKVSEVYKYLDNIKKYYLILDDNNNVNDFSKLKGENSIEFLSLTDILEKYFDSKSINPAINSTKSNYKRIIQNRINLVENKKIKLKTELEKTQDLNKYKIWAELLQAYNHSINNKNDKVKLFNYYTNKDEFINIDTNKSIIQNSNLYWKKHSKLSKDKIIKKEQLEKSNDELSILKNLEYNIENAETLDEIEEIKEELVNINLIRKKIVNKKAKKTSYLEFTFNDINYIVGKNNVQNDEITFKTRNKEFIWLHAKDIPGSHVIIKEAIDNLSNDELKFGLFLAAYYSKARGSENIAVDYTMLKYVKKRKGFPKGFVNYSNQKTVYTTYDLEMILKNKK